MESGITVFGGDCDHSTGGEVVAMGDELGGGGEVPTPAVEEDDGGATVVFVVEVGGEEKVGVEVSSGSLFVGVGGGGGEEFAVALFADHEGFRKWLH